MRIMKALSAGLTFFLVSYCAVVLAVPELAIATPQNDKQREMLKVIEHWQETYNSDVEKMILDCYAGQPNSGALDSRDFDCSASPDFKRRIRYA